MSIVSIDELAAQQPSNIEEALDAMRKGLTYFHARRDRRAIFLRLYYMMTLEVYAAIHGCRDYKGRRIFLDPEWVYRLSGKFSSLYFASLHAPEGDRAWRAAYRVARRPASSVIQNALLGINAHINFDLPRAIAANLDPGDLSSYVIMQKRKFDHDQVNNLLVRTVDPVQRVLARNYEPGIAVFERFLGGFDERACGRLLRTYREQVWWNAVAFAAAAPGAEQLVVRDKLEWESHQIAGWLRASRMWRGERIVNRVARPMVGRRWTAIPLERRCHDHRDTPPQPDPPEPDPSRPGRPLGDIGCSAPGA